MDVLRVMLTSQEKSANRMFSFFPSCDEKQKKRRATLASLFVVLSLC
jgi:hypothetical protein